jgi:murein DD-endopeptidase MepM/ murein hydrolase activator NlpD
LLYLGLFSAVLFGTFSLAADFIFKPLIIQGNFSLLAAVSEAVSQPAGKLLITCQKTNAKPLDLNIVQNNSLKGCSPPNTVSLETLGTLIGSSDSGTDSRQVVEYVVQAGETYSSIAEKFGISLDTVLWANNLDKSSNIKVGQKLVILPVTGVLYSVKTGDTMAEIAKTYKADAAEIIVFNDLEGQGDIYVGDVLIIPDGTKPKVVIPPAPQIPLASSYFIVPIAAPARITQGLHWYNAVDLSNGICGSPIFAAAGGQVLRTRFGWNAGAGNNLTILHPNGVVTMYGHLQTILVSPGDNVSQGEIIATMGGQPGTPGAGNSTGCHLHFQVMGAANPFAK